ncbi:peroxisome biogenesis factor 10, partial [Ascosphaera pollenicola]
MVQTLDQARKDKGKQVDRGEVADIDTIMDMGDGQPKSSATAASRAAAASSTFAADPVAASTVVATTAVPAQDPNRTPATHQGAHALEEAVEGDGDAIMTNGIDPNDLDKNGHFRDHVHFVAEDNPEFKRLLFKHEENRARQEADLQRQFEAANACLRHYEASAVPNAQPLAATTVNTDMTQFMED